MFEKPPSIITLDTIDDLCQFDKVATPIRVEKKQIDVVETLEVAAPIIEEQVPVIKEPEVVVVEPAKSTSYTTTRKTIDNIKWL